MSRHFHTLLLLAVVSLVIPASADIKAKTTLNMGGSQQETTVYVKGARQRTEYQGGMAGMSPTIILQCDQRRSIQLNAVKKLYLVTPLEVETEGGAPASATASKAAASNKSVPKKGGVITLTQNLQDTGERKQMFGYQARRIKSTTTMQASPDACMQSDMQIEADGWYADVSPGLSCESPRALRMPLGRAERAECQDTYRMKQTGNGKLGYPLQVATTFKGKGAQVLTMSSETVELSKTTLDPALFDVPAGYSEAKSFREMMPSMREIMRGAGGRMHEEEEAGPRPERESPEKQDAVPAKRPGVVRIGVVRVKNQTAQSLRDLRPELIEDLERAGIDAVEIESTDGEQATNEGVKKNCDYLLFTQVTAPKAASIGKKIGGTSGSMAGVGGSAGNSEITLMYKLFKTGSENAQLENSQTSRAPGSAEESANAAVEREVRDVVNDLRKHR